MDSAFKTAAFPGYTTAELLTKLAAQPEHVSIACALIYENMRAEIARREKVAAGDVSVMTPGERLRHLRKMEAAK